MFLWLQQSSEEMQSEGHDSEGTVADFGELLFFTSFSFHVSSADVLYSLGPTDEDINVVGEGPIVAATTGDSSEESASKDPGVAVTASEIAAGVPSQGYAISPTIHDAHHDKEPLGMVVLNCLCE